MHNTNKPSSNELPSAAALLRSTVLAILGAAVILVTVVLPAEYGIDPTGMGRLLGLTEMGEIKVQLAIEAEADRLQRSQVEPVVSAEATAEVPEPSTQAVAEPETRGDEISIELVPGQGAEVKLVMSAGDQADFDWTANGGLLNYDQHGDGDGRKISYRKGRAVPEDSGVIEAAFDGDHGWFWRNRTEAVVVMTLRTSGAYLELKRVL